MGGLVAMNVCFHCEKIKFRIDRVLTYGSPHLGGKTQSSE